MNKYFLLAILPTEVSFAFRSAIVGLIVEVITYFIAGHSPSKIAFWIATIIVFSWHNYVAYPTLKAGKDELERD